MLLSRSHFAAFAVGLLVAFNAQAADYRGKVIHVADGDTLTLLLEDKTSIKVRVNGIDAPEKKQAWGTRSAQNMKRLVDGAQVLVRAYKKDRYGRHVGQVFAGDVDAGLEQVRAGLAWVYRAYDKELSASDRAAYYSAEQSARSARLGLWSDATPVAPWDWRKARKAQGLR